MADYTPNLNLRKPTTGEYYDMVADLNDAKDKIDLAFGGLGANLEAKKEDKETTLKTDYTSLIGEVIKSYSYAMMESQISALATKYADKLTVETIGTSVLGRNIKAIILGNPSGKYKAFVMSGQHARESHNTPIILKQIEYYCENWDNLFKGELISDIFANAAIYYVPNANPDGMELCRIGINSVPVGDTSRINSIKAALEWKIKNSISRNNDVTPDWDLYPQIVWTGDTGKIANYVFRNQDMYMWKSNANGVDLHYNCYETGYNESYVQSYAASEGWRTSFATENYIGPSGFSEPETLAIKNFIESKGLTKYAISYHGRGPTMFWNYKEMGETARRNLMIAQDLADLSKTPYSQSVNGQVGFAGWFHARYPNSFSCIYETGWTHFPINPDNNYWETSNPFDICPLKDEQFPHIWKSQKETILMLMKRYAREQDVTTRKVILTAFDYNLTQSNLNNNGILKTPHGIIKMWGVAIADFTGLSRGYLDVTVNLPEAFPTKNLGGFANAYGTVQNTEIINFNVDKDSLNSIVVRVRSNANLNRPVPFYWCVEGF